MSKVTVGIIYIPTSMEELDLKRLSSEIVKDGKFIVEPYADDYYVTFSSLNEKIEVSVYFNGMVYYTKRIKEEDFTSRQIFNIAKEGFDFIKELSLDKNYSKRIGLVIIGEDMKKNYVEKEQVIKEFCMKLFKKPSFSELEKTDFDIQMSIVSEEVPLLSFSSND